VKIPQNDDDCKQRFLSHFENVRGSGGQYSARCKAHDDRNNSLSITEKADRWLIHCHAGCKTEDVVQAAGLTMADLFTDAATSASKRIVEEYPYTDESGKLLFEVVRFEPKDFRQRRPDGKGGWIWNLVGVRRVPYHLPVLLASQADEALVAEGERDVHTAEQLGYVATCNSEGAGKWKPEFSEFLRGKRVTVICDADPPGLMHGRDVARSCLGKASSVKIIEALPQAKDLSEWVERGGTRDELKAIIAETPELTAADVAGWTPSEREAKPGATPKLRVVDVLEFLKMEIPRREHILSPWLLCQSTNMIYAPRGTGKTLLGLSIAYAVASGGELLGWKAPKPRKVLYLDGEMLAAPLQERLLSCAAGATLPDGMLYIITPDLQEGFIPMPNLGTPGGQAAVSEAIDRHQAELIILDSLSSLHVTEVSENEAESWNPIAGWALQQRVKGRSIIFFHHANRQGGQRGTSKREDMLDITLVLRPGPEHEVNKQAKFEIRIEKARSMCPDFVPIETELTTGENNEAVWVARPLSITLKDRIFEMIKNGMKKAEIAAELHVSRSYVYKVLGESTKLKNEREEP